MYQLADRRGGDAGLYCGREGLFLGATPLIALEGSAYRLREEGEVTALVAAAYGSTGVASGLMPRLPLIHRALQQGDICKASILAVHARLDVIPTDGLVRLEKLAKRNFNPAEPRDWHGRWTDGDSGPTPAVAHGEDHPALIPVQEILLPFAARPPFLFEDPPKTFRPFKEPIPRLSGKEGAKDLPSWARSKRPYVGENGRDYAKRLMDEQYGRGNWRRTDREYRRIQKYGDRNFRDPRSFLLPDDDHI